MTSRSAAPARRAGPTAMSRSVLLLVLAPVLLALAVATTVGFVRAQGASTRPVAPARPDPVPSGAVRAARRAVGPPGALRVLGRWDAERATAWAHGDAHRLAALYTPRSLAGRADVAMLRRWSRRGLRVTGVRMRVLALTVRARSPSLLVLTVTDREVGAVAHTPLGLLRLPRDRPSQHRIELHRTTGRAWRVGAVSTR